MNVLSWIYSSIGFFKEALSIIEPFPVLRLLDSTRKLFQGIITRRQTTGVLPCFVLDSGVFFSSERINGTGESRFACSNPRYGSIGPPLRCSVPCGATGRPQRALFPSGGIWIFTFLPDACAPDAFFVSFCLVVIRPGFPAFRTPPTGPSQYPPQAYR